MSIFIYHKYINLFFIYHHSNHHSYINYLQMEQLLIKINILILIINLMQLFALNEYNEKQDDVQSSDIIEQHHENLSTVQSQFSDIYQQQIDMSTYPRDSAWSHLQKSSLLKFKEADEYQQFNFSIHKVTPTSQIVLVTVKFGKFSLKLLLLNEQGKNPFSTIQTSSKGSFGKIYFSQYQNQDIAVKSFFFNDQNRAKIITQAIKQYSILKICSILQISVKAEDYYGFNLILFEDSIIFAMERGKPITKMGKQKVMLKQMLGKMHSYNIVHYDIKPENICFSKKYNKIVFIDFGLSQIINERCGFKTFVNFRGSLNFCGPQIIKLFDSSNAYKYVDLYYNDLCCLINTFNSMPKSQNKLNQLEGPLFFENRQYQKFHAPIKQMQYVQPSFFLYSFKYYLISNQSQAINTLFIKQNDLLFRRYGKKILLFVKSLISFSFIQNIYNSNLGPLKQIFGHQEWKNISNMKKQHYQIKQRDINEEEVTNSHQFIFQGRFSFSNFFDFTKIKLNDEKYFQNCVYFLKNKKYFAELETKEQYLSIYIESLRFDRKNLPLKNKIQISIEFIKMTNLFYDNQKYSIQCVKITFLYLLKYCINQPLNSWKKQNIFAIIMQNIILGVNMNNIMNQLIDSLNILFQNGSDKLALALKMHYVYCLGKLKHIEHQSMCNFEIIKQFKTLYQQILSECYQNGKNSQNIQQHAISIIIFQLRKKQHLSEVNIQNCFKQLNKQLKNIFNLVLRMNLKQFICYQFLNRCFLQGQYKYFEIFFKMIRNQIYCDYQFSNKYLHYGIFYIYSIMTGRENYREIKILSDNIQRIINCEEVFSQFKFKMATFLYNDNNETELLYHYLNKIINFEQKELEKGEIINIFQIYGLQIYKILFNIQQNKEFCKKYSAVIQIFFNKWQYWQNIIKKQTIFIDALDQIMYFYYINAIFCKINPLVNKNFRSRLNQIMQQIIDKPQITKISLYKELQHQIYLVNFYQQEKQWDKSQRSFQKLLKLGYETQNLKFIAYCLKNIILLNKRPNKINKRLIEWLRKFYQFNIKQKSMIWYFDQFSVYIIATTLIKFKQEGYISRTYQLLKYLSKFLSFHPLYQYSKEWFQNIISFSKSYPQVFQLSLLEKYIGQISWDNRYLILYYVYSLDIQLDKIIKYKILKRIACNLSGINVFIKEKILKKYYTHFQNLEKVNSRKNNVLFLKLQYKYLDKKINFSMMKKEITGIKHQKFQINRKLIKIKQKMKKINEIVKLSKINRQIG